jgi:hypothetical protein
LRHRAKPVLCACAGFILTEGLTTCFSREKDQAAMLKFGMGSTEDLLKLQGLMLSPEDIGYCVWEVVSKPSNYYVNDIHLRDGLQ